MIIRVFRVKVFAGMEAEFEEKFREVSLPLVKSQDGFISLYAGKPVKFDPQEYVLVTTWESEAALRDFAGDNWNKPVIPPGMEKYIE
ncbi:MAG: antibiotic biosynthesis monooxygenase, partial [Gammaproteobacteria bacterium]|nr:antibiotic biosynthesis monooxygenase [Gammaproteobacteria bacterium]